MQSMPSSTWAEANRQPLESGLGAKPKIDLLMTRRERHDHRLEGVDDQDKWPRAVRLALLAGGLTGSWGLVWLVGHEVAKMFH